MKEYSVDEENIYINYLLECIDSCSFICSKDAVMCYVYFQKNRWHIHTSEPNMKNIFKTILYDTYQTILHVEYMADIMDTFLFTLDTNLAYQFIMSPSEKGIWFDKCFFANNEIRDNSTILPYLPSIGKTFKISETFKYVYEITSFVKRMNPSTQRGLFIFTPYTSFMIKNPGYEPYHRISEIAQVDCMEVTYLRLSDSDRAWFNYLFPNALVVYDYFIKYTFVLYLMRFVYSMKLYTDEIILNDIHQSCEGKPMSMKQIELYFSQHIDIFIRLFNCFINTTTQPKPLSITSPEFVPKKKTWASIVSLGDDTA